MRYFVFTLALGGAALLAACTTAHPGTSGSTATRMTLGVVQMSVHEGMNQSAVAETLGAPNIVTRDSDGNETWIYDKVASYASYKHSSVYGTILVFGGSSGSANTTTGQRTLTVIIKFDKNQKVKSFSYNSSTF